MKELTKEQKTECLDYIIEQLKISGIHICPIKDAFINNLIKREFLVDMTDTESKVSFPELHKLIMVRGQVLAHGNDTFEYGDPWNYFVRTRDCRAFKIKILTEFRKALNL